jgi:hypothetical protein
MSTNGGTRASILLSLIILGFYISLDSAKAEEPGEDVIQELIHSDARAASAVNSRAPYLPLCEKLDNNESGQLPAQGSTGAQARRGFITAFSSHCKLYELLARGDFEVRKVGCVKSENSLGYNCDFIIQPKAPEGEEAAIIGQFFNPNIVYTSRFVPFGSKWYLALDTSPFVVAGFIRGAFSPR